MAIDNKLTERVREWLMADDHTSTEDIINGATMLLQLNRNRALFNTIVRRPERYVEKIRYELKKFLPSRLDGMTMNDVERMQGEVLPPVKAAIDEEPGAEAEESDADERPLPLRNGKRADHDSLPEQIGRAHV